MPVMFAALLDVLLKRLDALGRHDLALILGAYLDDTTAGANIKLIEEVLVAAKELAPELMGVEINAFKSVVACFGPAPSAKILDCATRHNVTVHHEMTAFVGGVVGTDTARMSQFIIDKVLSQRRMFLVLTHPRMHPAVAIRLLRHAAYPMMNFLVRGHSPEVTGPAVALFDQAVEATYIAIARAPDLLLPSNAMARRQFRLPINKAGEGLGLMSDIALAAYYAACHNSEPHVAKAVPAVPGPPQPSASQPPQPPPCGMDDAPEEAPAAPAAAPAVPAVPIPAAPEELPEAAPIPPDDPPDAPPLTTQSMRVRGIHTCRTGLHERAPRQFASTPLPAITNLSLQDVRDNQAKATHVQAAIMLVIAEADLESVKKLADPNARALARLTALLAPGAGAVLNADLSDHEQCLSATAYRHYLRTRKGMAPSVSVAANPLSACCCGFLLSGNFSHFKTCAQFRLEQNRLHNGVRDQVHEMAEGAGASASIEQTLPGTQAKVNKKGSGRRVDNTVRWHGLDQDDLCDVSVTDPTADCYLSSPASLTDPLHGMHARAQVKRDKYEQIVEDLGGHFVPLIFSSLGNGTPAVHAFLHKITNSAEYTRKSGDFSVKTLSTRIAATILEHASFCTTAGIGRMKDNWVSQEAAAV